VKNFPKMQRNFSRNILERGSRGRTRTLLVFLIVASISGALLANEHSVTFDDRFDFSKLRTFAIREAKCDSTRPELNNPLYMKKLADAIRASLSAKGMKETADQPDMFVDYRIDGTELSTADRPSERLRGGVLYAQGTVTVNLFSREPRLLVWEGIYRGNESNGSKLAQGLPSEVQKLLSKYPPKK
jgi:hypothetical protein